MLLYTVVVSTLIWVIQATPTGNHTCTGVVKHPVTVRVNVTEPVTYRTYTWCLKVPPRCSKYTVQLQDRVKIHTEMHNRTITVCCKGYVEIDYKCVPACPPQTECPFMHCNRTNHCYCSPGYTGLYCNEPCEKGFWGESCLKECDCPTGYTCHHLTGDCMVDDRPSKIRRTTVSDVEPSTVSTTTVKHTTERRTAPTTTTTTTTATPSTTLPTTPLTTTVATTTSTTTVAKTTLTTTVATTPSTTTVVTTPSTTSVVTTPSTTTVATTPTTTTTSTTPSTIATTIATEPTTSTIITRPTISSIHGNPPKTSESYVPLATEVTTKELSTSQKPSLPSTSTTEETKQTSTTEASTQTTTTEASTQTTTTEASTPTSTTEASTLPTSSTPLTESITLSPSSTSKATTTTTTSTTTTTTTEKPSMWTSESISSTAKTTEFTKPYRTFTEPQMISSVSTPGIVLTSPTTTTERLFYSKTPELHEATTKRVTEPIFTTKAELSTFASQSTSDSSSHSMTTAAPSTSETTATSINLSTRPKPDIFTTVIEYSTRKETTPTTPETKITEKSWPKTTVFIPTTLVETTWNTPKEGAESKTTREESFENMPPMMVNRKKHISSSEKETERSVVKEDSIRSTTSTTETTKTDEGVHHFAPMVPFPHHTRTQKPPTTFLTSTQTVTVPTTTTTSTAVTETTQNTKSPLDFLQPFKTFEISNGDNSITAPPPNENKITTQKSMETYIDNSKRLWEIFETGLNLKTTSSPIRTLPPIGIAKTERPLEKYGDVEKPIKKSDKDSMESATAMTTPEEKETSAESFSKQLKYKEKYQKKVKTKAFDVTSSPQETAGTASSTDYKILKPAKYPKSSKTEFDEQKTEKEITTESTTPYRPSHTWYSHAREKAKIKEAMKSLKTTIFDVKPTEAFDNESNDINLMQTAFTETSRNLREERNHKKGSIEANMINMTRPITRYAPQEITAGNDKDFTFYSNLIIIVGVSILMLLTLVTLFWIRANKMKRNEGVSPGSSIVAYSTQSETVSPLMYETVYPLNGGPELMEAATFFCPTFTNHYAERINRELSELSYDHPPSRRPLKFNQYTEVSLDTNK